MVTELAALTRKTFCSTLAARHTPCSTATLDAALHSRPHGSLLGTCAVAATSRHTPRSGAAWRPVLGRSALNPAAQNLSVRSRARRTHPHGPQQCNPGAQPQPPPAALLLAGAHRCSCGQPALGRPRGACSTGQTPLLQPRCQVQARSDAGRAPDPAALARSLAHAPSLLSHHTGPGHKLRQPVALPRPAPRAWARRRQPHRRPGPGRRGGGGPAACAVRAPRRARCASRCALCAPRVSPACAESVRRARAPAAHAERHIWSGRGVTRKQE